MTYITALAAQNSSQHLSSAFSSAEACPIPRTAAFSWRFPRGRPGWGQPSLGGRTLAAARATAMGSGGLLGDPETTPLWCYQARLLPCPQAHVSCMVRFHFQVAGLSMAGGLKDWRTGRDAPPGLAPRSPGLGQRSPQPVWAHGPAGYCEGDDHTSVTGQTGTRYARLVLQGSTCLAPRSRTSCLILEQRGPRSFTPQRWGYQVAPESPQ